MLTTQTVRAPTVARRPALVGSWPPRQRRWAVRQPANVRRRIYWRRVGSPQPAASGSNASASPVPPVVLTVAEACAVLRISKWTLYELIRSRQLQTVKIGARRVIPISAVHALLDRLGGEETA